MITAAIIIHGRPEKRTEILQTIKGIMGKLLKDTKCREVKIYRDIDDENTFFFVENWLSEDDLNDYFCSRLFKILLGINPLLESQLEITLFTGAKKIVFEDEEFCQNQTIIEWEGRA